ncbi:MAG TPA: alpha-amylase family glycosyl hydrolase [Gaiellaceae bacterium]
MSWWREGVLYQIYPRSFADSNRDGVGDLRGIVEHLDHLAWLGVSGIWLSPTFPSPNADWGYDVADYYGVHPELGTLADLDALIAEARRRGVRVLLDLVPNHTSDRHSWFTERPEFYVWSDHVPNNWTSFFTKGSAWRYDAARRRYYLHLFAPGQPDLDWWNPDVRGEFDRILRFWFERGVAGFRIDVAHGLVKDRELRDNRIAVPGDPKWAQRLGHWNDRSMNQPEVHDVFRRWKELTREYDPEPILYGETVVGVERLPAFYGNGGDELDLAFNFDFLQADFEVGTLRPIVERIERELPPGAWPTYTVSNHDNSRAATRWAGGDERKMRAALFLLLTLRGTPFLFQGDEIALEDGEVPPGRILDIADPPRDPGRTPLPWTRSGEEWHEPWLPVTDTTRNVEDQRADPSSMLNYTRDLIERRRAFALEPYETVPSREGVWAYRRGATDLAVNLTDEESEHAGRRLAPWEGAILT